MQAADSQKILKIPPLRTDSLFFIFEDDVFNLKQAGCFGLTHSTYTLENEKHSVRLSCFDDEIVPAHMNEVFFIYLRSNYY